jgi:hypothetical protein
VTATLALLDAVDGLYEKVVTDPGAWRDDGFAEWAEEVGATAPTREQRRLLNRCLRVAAKLQRYWFDPPTAVTADDWRSRVDIAVGVPAWRPTLELAELGLDTDPSEALFDQVAARFRVVHSRPFMDGIDYEAWSSTPRQEPS